MEILAQLLKPLSALVLPDKVLPKYLYPSAGSSYAVQAYLSIPDHRIPGLAGGEYYYHPIKHELQRTKELAGCFGKYRNNLKNRDFGEKTPQNFLSGACDHCRRQGTSEDKNSEVKPTQPKTDSSGCFGISFKLFLPAIEPLYGDESLRLGFLEMGHILYCLENQLSILPITYRVEIQNVRDHDHHLLLTIHFDTPGRAEQKTVLHKTLLLNQNGCFRCKEKEFDLKQQSLVIRASETGQLLSHASSLLVFEGEQNPENLIAAGFEAQAISEQYIEIGIGSCPIGIEPYDQALYALAIGKVDTSIQEKAESKGKSIPLDQQIAEELRHQLPSYMVPETYIPLSSFPLTANGKVDYQALPLLPEASSENAYDPPETPLEIAIAEIWQASLSIDRLSVHDDFFRLGGNSLLAIKTAHRLSQALGKHIKVIDIFNHRTVSNLAALLSENCSDIIILKTEQKTAPLSFAQERLWFIEKYEQSTNAYHIPIGFKVNGNKDLSAIKHSLQSIVARHEILRTVYFQDEKGKNYQRITDQPLIVEETETNKIDLEKILLEQVNRSFDLEKELPIRVAFYHTGPFCYVSVVIHHIAFDGWSSAIFLKELNEFYNHYTNYTPLNLPELTIQYKDFGLWQRSSFQRDSFDKQSTYWQEKLKEIEPLYFPTDYPRPPQTKYEGNEISFTLDKETSSKLRNLAKEYRITLFTLLLSGFSILIHKYTGQCDIVIGTPIASRLSAQMSDLIGFFVNTLVIRQLISPEASGKATIQDFHTTLLEAQIHQDLPFEKLVELLGIERDQSRHPLFQIMFRVQDFTAPSQFESYNTEKFLKVSKFDFDLLINDKDQELKGTLTYSTSLFKKETAEAIANHYIQLLDELLKEPTRSIKEYQILTPEERHKMIYSWNQTNRDYPKETTICHLFEKQVSITPHKIAVIVENQQITYAELNAKANQLARYLRGKIEIQPDTLIALCMTRSVEMMIGILAIMKAKAAYVPIDPEYPAERIGYMIKDTQTKLILTHSNTMERVRTVTSIPLIALDAEEYQTERADNLKLQQSGTDLAYVIYTSGTTGHPKGVMVTHDCVSAYIHAAKEHIYDSENIDFSTELSFDLSVTTTLLPLVTGKSIYIFVDKLTQINEYVEHINRNKIDFIKSTPSFLCQIPFENVLHKVKTCFIGGEKCDTHQIQYLLKHIDRLYDEYGPTEATVGTTLHACQYEDNHIGKPYPNYKVYVLDAQQQPVPIGVIGELYIGGGGVARGYLNQPNLTAEKFIINPFATQEDIAKGYTRLYKTGDLVKWLSNGNLEYINRNDSQVKIRGFRIELEEIESALSSISGIRQASVVVHEQNHHQFLVGYFVAEEGMAKRLYPKKENDFLHTLSEKLPNYMIPNMLIKMERFPLTQNGKLDKKALPAPDFKREAAYLPPTTDLERKLCKIWEQILHCEKVGMTDDFFRIGGNSILAIQASHQMSKALGSKIQVSSLFKHKNIATIIDSLQSQDLTQYSHTTLLSQTESKHKPCLFLIHGVGGNIASYYKIIDLLESHYNLYGIQSGTGFKDYQEMIQEYSENIDAILHKMNTTHYNIIGWSYGASCALEIISSLSNQYDCDQAFLIDGAPIDDKKNHSLNNATIKSSLTDNLKDLLSFYKDTFDLEENIEAMTQEGLLRHVHQVFGYSSKEEDLAVIEDRVSVALLNIRNHVLHSKLTPSLYSAKKFHIITAEKTIYKFNNWESILQSDSIEISDIAGDHWSIMTSSELINYFHSSCILR
ncbi:MAG: amino acid adenylation domain-containing protein [Chlamydiales bacterium]|nr:amino acid adenylation domain-containing protein [Chlamydiales bacterium]